MISDAKKRKSIPAEWLLTLLLRKGINPQWVLTGTGPRYLQAAEVTRGLPQAGSVDPVSLLKLFSPHELAAELVNRVPDPAMPECASVQRKTRRRLMYRKPR